MRNLNTHNLVELYRSGQRVSKIAEDLGVGYDCVARRLKKAGVDLRARQYRDVSISNSHPHLDLPIEEIGELFEGGMSTKALSEKFGCSRRAIDARLVSLGKCPRNGSESMILRMQQSSDDQRKQLTKAAHAAVRGVSRTFEELCKRAKSRQSCYGPRLYGHHEREFYRLSQMTGLEIVPQYAVGPYNVDFLLAGSPITVEVYGGKWHGYGVHVERFRQRSEYIRDSGLACVIVWCLDGTTIQQSCIGYLQSLVKKSRRKKSVLREQYVILGNGEATTFHTKYIDYLSGVMRFENGQYVVG